MVVLHGGAGKGMTMKLKALAEVASTPVSTVKFYLREGLLPPGEKLNATTAAYGRRHVERLELIGALRQVVGLGLKQVRQVVEAVEDLDPIRMMGRVQSIVMDVPAGGGGPASAETTAETSAGMEVTDVTLGGDRLSAHEVMDAMGWRSGTPESVEALDRHLTTMARWGLAPSLAQALVYARGVDEVAAHELTRSSPWSTASGEEPPSQDVIATYTAVGIHAYSQLLLRLHAVAQGSHARGLGAQMAPDGVPQPPGQCN